MSRKQTVDEESICCNDEGRDQCVQDKQKRDGNPFMHSIGVLKRVVAEGEVLVVWLDGIKSVEGEEEDPSTIISLVRSYQQRASIATTLTQLLHSPRYTCRFVSEAKSMECCSLTI